MLVAGTAWQGVPGDDFICVSTNAGLTWTPTCQGNQVWQSIAASADGTKLAALSQHVVDSGIWTQVYTSTNSGMTWSLSLLPEGWEQGTYLGNSIAASADGTKLAVTGSGSDQWINSGVGWSQFAAICVSTNAGLTWTQSDAPDVVWQCIASSADGTKLAATACGYNYEPVYIAGIWTSTDSGSTWTQSGAPENEPGYGLYSIASSADGTKLVSGGWHGSYGGIYASTDSGLTWTETSAPEEEWQSIASSADGTVLAAAAWGGVWVSTNAGLTWTQTSCPAGAQFGIACSADGTQLAVYNGGSGIWTAQATIQAAAPALCISQSGNGIVIYWPAVSGWTLQQNTDLLNSSGWSVNNDWITTSGTNYLSLTAPTGNLYFRLSDP